MRRYWATLLLVVILAVSAAREAKATDWAKAMLDHTTHDFGMVPRGSEAEHRFTIDNIYLEDAHIKSVSSSCKCTTVKVTKPAFKTHEKSQIVATLNTRQFTGKKDATIRVVFDKPFPAEVQLHIHSYIRTDVVLEPGCVRFGQVTQGATATRTVNLRHAGDPNWKITGQENEDPNIAVSIRPTTSTSGQASYQLAFTLKDTTPAGYIRRHVTLRTNDQNPNAQRVLIPIEGVVAPAVSVRPSPVAFGAVQVGREATKNVVVQGQENFQILGVTGPDDRFGVVLSGRLKTASRLHLIPVTFKAGTSPGKIGGELLIRTDIGDGRVLRVEVTGDVVDGSKPTTLMSPSPDETTSDETPPDETPPDETPPDEKKKSSVGWRRAGED